MYIPVKTALWVQIALLMRQRWRTRLAPYPAPVRMAGFTLIELSIVLVVIGLIVGGVLVGQDLIKAAKLRSTLTELEEIKMGIVLFKNKYQCLPGDCNKVVALGLDFRDGDGNRSIGYDHPGDYENYRAWHQMSKAGVIKWDIESAQSVGVGTKTLGVHHPKSIYGDNIGWGFGFEGSQWLILAAGVGGHTEFDGSSNNSVKAVDAFDIDLKLDDGKPNSGRVRDLTANSWGNPGCRSGTGTSASITYRLDRTNCKLFFENSY